MSNNAKEKNALVRFWHNYILGRNHCDSCPYAWSEYSAGCDEWDGGCIIKGECADDGCRLLPPFRAVIGWVRKKQYDYCRDHEYDGYLEFTDKENEKKCALGDSIKKHILLQPYRKLYYLDCENKAIEIDENCIDSLFWDELWRVKSEYEDVAHPYVNKTLWEEWRELLHKTVRRWVQPLKPFLPKVWRKTNDD